LVCPVLAVVDVVHHLEHLRLGIGRWKDSSKGHWRVTKHHFDHVVTVGSSGSFTGVTSLAITGGVAVVVRVGASPLDMHRIAFSDLKVVWHEIVLDGWEALYNVAPFATHVQVINVRVLHKVLGCYASDARCHGFAIVSGWTRLDVENVTSILERTTELGRVDGETEGSVHGTDVDIWVLSHWGLDTLTVVLVEARVGHTTIVVISGDVISETKNALLIVTKVRDGPVVAVGLTVSTVTEMVDSRPW